MTGSSWWKVLKLSEGADLPKATFPSGRGLHPPASPAISLPLCEALRRGETLETRTQPCRSGPREHRAEESTAKREEIDRNSPRSPKDFSFLGSLPSPQETSKLSCMLCVSSRTWRCFASGNPAPRNRDVFLRDFGGW